MYKYDVFLVHDSGIILNIFSWLIDLLSTKLAWNLTVRISAISHFARTSVLPKPQTDILQVRLSRVNIISTYVSMASKRCWNWNLTVLT